MCGFFIEYKFINFSENIQNFNLSSKLIQHRGDQPVKSYSDKNIRVNFYRLKIVDLSNNGDQPMFDHSNRYLIAFNGEIYNAKELRKLIPDIKYKGKSDTELLINLYSKFKENILDLIEGMFSFVIYDKLENKCFASRDRFGIKPLYFHRSNNSIIFSSEIKPILKYKCLNNFNNYAFYDFFINGFLDHNNLTFFDKVESLEPANYMEIKQNKINIKKYWDITIPMFKYDDNCLNNLEELLNYSIKQHLVSDREIGLFLSGGVDSSALAGILKNNFNYSCKTFTYDFANSNLGEHLSARNYAKKYKLKNTTIIVKPADIEKKFNKLINVLESPFTSIRAFGVDKIYESAKKDGLKVIIEGHGGDEMLGGYGYNRLALQHSMLKKNSKLNNNTDYNKKYLKEFMKNQGHYTGDGIKFYNKNFFNFDFLKKYNNTKLFNKKKLTNLQQSQYKDLKLIKLPRVLKYTDRISMSYGIETRVPFLNHKLFNFCFHLDDKLKFSNNISRYLFKKVLIRMKLIDNIEVNKSKKDVVDPQKEWLQKKNKSFLLDNFNSSEFKNCEFLNQKLFKNYLKLFLKTKQNSSYTVFTILSALIFMRNFKNRF